MWCGCINQELNWRYVTSWDEIQMVHQSMTNGLMVADKFYIMSVLAALDGFLILLSSIILFYGKASYDLGTA
jgi:hypothetical protein